MSDQSGFENSHYYALPVGTNLFEFRIEQVLGHGGFGITYLATDTNLDERVAIKEYMPNEIAVRVSDSTVRAKTRGDNETLEQGLNSFLEEARTIARFRHRNIVHVRRFFRLHGTAYIVLDYEDGQTLGQYLETHKMGNDQLRDLLSGVLDGLDVVHARATLHRDLKPSNIILRPDQSPVLIDFGASRDFQSRNSKSVTAIATAGYSPPEQYIGGQQGPWTDLYSLGAIAYRIVSGATPPDSLRRLRKDPLVPASSLDTEYDPAILRTIDWMLKIDESERPISVDAVRDSLSEAAFDVAQNTVGGAGPHSAQSNKSASDRQKVSADLSVVKSSTSLWPRLAYSMAALVALAGILTYGMNFYKDSTKQSQTTAPTSTNSANPPAEKATPTYDLKKISDAWDDKQKLKALLDQCSTASNCTDHVTSTINNRLWTIEQQTR
jgi:serine/threonine protein kinase